MPAVMYEALERRDGLAEILCSPALLRQFAAKQGVPIDRAQELIMEEIDGLNSAMATAEPASSRKSPTEVNQGSREGSA